MHGGAVGDADILVGTRSGIVDLRESAIALLALAWTQGSAAQEIWLAEVAPSHF
ncbi:MAG TPA: hypothetical protein VFV38_13825 [Ktedonobacteraceae bacterium]|nr:hypothetical protein [Ktedonobacteraceae bacterium]